jgi:hypothetical protein
MRLPRRRVAVLCVTALRAGNVSGRDDTSRPLQRALCWLCEGGLGSEAAEQTAATQPLGKDEGDEP